MRKMSEEDKRNVKNIVDEIESDKEKERKGKLTNFSIRSLNV